MAVNKISNEKIQRLRNKSIEKLPDIVRGISPTELKKKFTGFVLDPTDSLVDEINRIVEEVNQKGLQTKGIIMSKEEPDDKTKGTLWLKILDDEED